jgi:glucokinase
LAAQAPEKPAGVGIGSPGRVDSKEGTVINAVNLGWDQVRLVDEVQYRLTSHLPVWIEKDTKTSVLGEYYFGTARGIRDLVFLSVGSGLGAGIIANGQLVVGANRIAANLGHLSFDPEGRPCVCGLRGCVEKVASGQGLVNITQEFALRDSWATRMTEEDRSQPSRIVAFARQGDELALAALNEVGRWLGMAMASVVVLLNPAIVILGGGLGLAAADLLIPRAWREVSCRADALSRVSLQILPSSLPSSAVGAACLAWRGSEEHD